MDDLVERLNSRAEGYNYGPAMRDIPKLLKTASEALERWQAVKRLSDKMAEDDGLWFVAENASEAYLQQELRKLCGAIDHASSPLARRSEDHGR